MSRTSLSEERYRVSLPDYAERSAKGDRISTLPLILAGPILRRTESNAVTVWVALKAPREVTLKIYATDAKGTSIKHLLLEGIRATVPLGKHLHVVAVTAKPVSDKPLEPGQIYAYDLSFGQSEPTLVQALNANELHPPVTVSYFEHQLPTFALPPEDLNYLRIAHGSCRKLHSDGLDALPMLDDAIAYRAEEPNSRLHQLFFTGDQIYGDDVADPLLWTAIDIGDTLLGWEEHLPMCQTPTTDCEYKKHSEFKPGHRTDVARDYGGLTAMLIDTPEEAKSHLFGLGEYFAIYLLFWSPILWSESFPAGKDIHQDSKQARHWDNEARRLKKSLSLLWKARRAMANVPTYMIFDDHDISDDWYLNRAWCNSVLGKPLGRRVVFNGLLAYAVFQAWGNTPEQFQEGQPGGNLLQAAAAWSASAGTDEAAAEAITKYLGLPQSIPETGLPQFQADNDVLILDRAYPDGTPSVEWHYTVRSPKHEVLVLDTRTWRGYPQGDEGEGCVTDCAIAPPMLLCHSAFEKQLQQPLELSDRLNQTHESSIEVTFVILPTNLVSLRIIDIVQQWQLEKGNVFDSDVGDAWNLNEIALSRLLTELFERRQRVVVLSGDIHYAGAVRLSYWSNRHLATPPSVENQASSSRQKVPSACVLAQLTASAFKNDEFKTHLVNTKVKSLALEPSQDWAGWNEPPQLYEIQVMQERVRILDVEVPETGPLVRQIKGTRGNWDVAWEIGIKERTSLPDWQYHIEWVKRHRATVAPWQGKLALSESSQHKKPGGLLARVRSLVSMLWRNRWVQEGEEVIGRNNFGAIGLQWSPNDENAKAVIQDVYWRPPWNPTSVVYSRYLVPLHVDRSPPQLRTIAPNLKIETGD